MNAVIVFEDEPGAAYIVKPVTGIVSNLEGQVVDVDETTWKRWQAVDELWRQFQDELHELYNLVPATEPPPRER